MSASTLDRQAPLRARIPADLERPDTIIAGLSGRQVLVLAGAALPLLLAFHAAAGRVPLAVLGAVGLPWTAAALVLALGRRDGVGLDAWVLAALRHGFGPRLLLPGALAGRATPAGSTWPGSPAPARAGRLRLPFSELAADGVITGPGGQAMALLALSPVTTGLHTPREQAALVAGFARWLNSLTAPVQVVISSRPQELGERALRVAEQAHALAHPALARTAIEHADFLLDLGEDAEPLARSISVLCPPGPALVAGPRRTSATVEAVQAGRRAQAAAEALGDVGARSRILEGGDVRTVLARTLDPFGPYDTEPGWHADPGDQTRAQARLAPEAEVPGPVRPSWLGKTFRRPSRGQASGPDGPVPLDDLPTVMAHAGDLRVGRGWAATLVVCGYPSEVGMSWLEAILRWPGRLDLAVHIEPVPAVVAASRLRRQRARLESVRRIDATAGRLGDPLTEAAAQDAQDLAEQVARGEANLFRVGIYLTVHARDRAGLHEAVAQVRAAAASVMLELHPATWRQVAGWMSTLPLGHDGLQMRRVMDTASLAASFPLASPDLAGPLPGEQARPGGVLHGVNLSGGGVVWWDRWAQENANSVVLASSGAGKSYLMKLEVLRHLLAGVQVAVVDPEDEYTTLAHAVGGTVIQLGAPGVRINPLDLPAGDTRADALTRRAMFVHTLVAVLLGGPPPPQERAALDMAVQSVYAAAGFTSDPATLTRPAPLLADVVTTLLALGDEHGHAHAPGVGQPVGQHEGQPVGQLPGQDGGHAGGRAGGHDPDGRDLAGGGRSHAGPDLPGQGSGGQGSRGHGSGGQGIQGHWPASAQQRAAAASLAARLTPWTRGSFRQLFDGPGTVALQGHLIVWSTRHLPDELRAAGMLLALDAVWRDIDVDTHRPTDPALVTSQTEPTDTEASQSGVPGPAVGTATAATGHPPLANRDGRAANWWPHQEANRPADPGQDRSTTVDTAPALSPTPDPANGQPGVHPDGQMAGRTSGGTPTGTWSGTPSETSTETEAGTPTGTQAGTPTGKPGRTAGPPRRLIVVDEAWSLMREGEGAAFLARVAKSARKRRAGLAVVTQDIVDLLGSDLGRIVVANAATQILLRQAPQAIDEVAAAFDLSAGEAQLLSSAGRGQALLLAGGQRVAFQTVASQAEHQLASGWSDLLAEEPERTGPQPGDGESTGGSW